jgi:hypothetical protein
MVLVRRYGMVVLGVLAVFGTLSTRAHAQRLPIYFAPGAGANLNPFLNPYAALAVGSLGSSPVSYSGYGGLGGAGLGYGSLGVPAAYANLGYGSLPASYANPALGYGSLLNGGYGGYGGAGGYGGYGGYATQWMLNPYEGYLRGTADVTNANAKYQLTIQQAKLERQQAVQEAIKTRRAWLEEAEYERAHMPDPEKIRQRALERELDRARVSPPLTEIWSGRSLNALLRNAIAQQGQGSRGPNVPLSEDTLKAINPTAGDTNGNVGLLKDNGKLQWPQPLLNEAFKEPREDLSRHLRQAFNSVQGNNSPDESTLSDLQVDLKKLQAALDANISALSPDQYVEARRYVRLLGNTITALKDRNVVNIINGAWALKGKNVAELVQYMRDKGLWFAPATPGDESAYTALYHALAAFDAGMSRVARTSDNDEREK